VAVVGVDVNSGSVEILQKVPGLSASLSQKIIKARPLKRRNDLLNINGLGPKSFENCAGFVRVANGPEPLDDTLVHPESYELANWLLKEFSWELDTANKDIDIPRNRDEWSKEWKDSVAKAAERYSVSQERVLAVLYNLVDSMSKKDPRLKLLENGSGSSSKASTISSPGLVASCKPLEAELSDTSRLLDLIREKGGPIRGIIGTIRNVADFGAFVDIGIEDNGLLHISKLGPKLQLQALLIGQHIGVDILSAAPKNNRISLGLHGCNFDASVPRNASSRPSSRTNNSRVRGFSSVSSKKRSSGSKRSMSSKTGNSRASDRPTKQKRRRVG